MAEAAQVAAIRRKIWLTYKTRMVAESRLRNYGTLSHLATLWASLNLILYSIFNDLLAVHIPFFNKLIVCLSIAVFSLSIGNYVFRFFERAQLYRECYLKLQKLYDCHPPEKDLAENYHDILEQYPNHADRDYDDLIVGHVTIRGGEVLNSDGKPIKPTAYAIILFALRKLGFAMVIPLTAGTPLAPYIFVLVQ